MMIFIRQNEYIDVLDLKITIIWFRDVSMKFFDETLSYEAVNIYRF
jgi:hypothetical protein